MEPETGRANRGIGRAAYTLIELLVVIALLTIMLGFSMPRLYRNLTPDSPRQIMQWFELNVPALKTRAIETGLDHYLYFDRSRSSFWIAHEGLDAADLAQLEQDSTFTLPAPYFLQEVTFPLIRYPEHEPTAIRFFRQGYSDAALLHISNRRGHKLLIRIEPFLTRVEILEQ